MVRSLKEFLIKKKFSYNIFLKYLVSKIEKKSNWVFNEIG